ncbi:MAG: rhomboid family intramembrane serine protease [Flavobacteriales bacterium]|nr:rhomboid family intramembrane serine protease [Flavobacteriales bacterium]
MPPESSQPVIRHRALNALLLPFVGAVVLWAIWLLDAGLELDLGRYGLLPRTGRGLVGIFTAPLLHADLEHLFNNTTGLLMLGWCLMYFYPRVAGSVVLVSWLASGVGVWLMGRSNIHIGASGVIYGLAAFLFVSGLLRKQRTLMALSLLVVFLYGSLIWGIFPIVERLSWESHLWGGIAGVALAYFHRSVPPAVSDPRPAFTDEEEEEDEPVPPYAEGDPGDEVDDAELAWKRKLAEGAERPGNVSTTWDAD